MNISNSLDANDYIFLVDSPLDKARFDRAGIRARVYDKDNPPTERIVFYLKGCLSHNAAANSLKREENLVVTYPAHIFLCEPEDRQELTLRSRAYKVMSIAYEQVRGITCTDRYLDFEF